MSLLDMVVMLEEEASESGFRCETSEQIMNQIQSECEEIQEHLRAGISKSNQTELQDEIGDLLHAEPSVAI
jgi:ATP diphosphatase